MNNCNNKPKTTNKEYDSKYIELEESWIFDDGFEYEMYNLNIDEQQELLDLINYFLDNKRRTRLDSEQQELLIEYKDILEWILEDYSEQIKDSLVGILW